MPLTPTVTRAYSPTDPLATNPTTARPGTGLYRLKPWFAGLLTPVLDQLAHRRVDPDLVSWTGVGAAAAGGAALAFLAPGPLAAAAVLIAAVVRLACANLDGNLARRQRPSRRGAVINELGDRLADLALLAGLAVHLTGPLGGLVLLASCLPSWVALAGASAGTARRNGGPVGKTERAALCVVAAATGAWFVLGIVIAAGSAITAALRLRAALTDLGARTLAR